MNAIKLACFAFLCSSSLAQAAVPCDAFQIIVKNQSSDNLLSTNIHLNGAAIEPNGIQGLDSKSSQIFTVRKSQSDVTMTGDMVFRSITLKKVTIKFNLTNYGLICMHNDKTSGNDYSVEHNRSLNSVEYIIH